MTWLRDACSFAVPSRRGRPGFVTTIPLQCLRPSIRTVQRQLCSMVAEREGGVRINKCFSKFASRRQADMYVDQGRVAVNGVKVAPGARVFSGDDVTLDGDPVVWEQLLANDTSKFRYLKHWKRTGVVCTTDSLVENNIIDDVRVSDVITDRIFPVGRLDENSSGLILLTSDGRVPNAVLGASRDCAKEYIVTPDQHISNADIEHLRNGVIIKTVAQRDRGVRKPLIAKTLPCIVERAGGIKLRILLKEGRNRQIRRMLGVLGITVRAIHRSAFMGITLDGLENPGDWTHLNKEEMALIERKLGELTLNV